LTKFIIVALLAVIPSAVRVSAQARPAQSTTPVATTGQSPDMPADYKSVLDTLGKQGDFKDGVLKVNIPEAI